MSTELVTLTRDCEAIQIPNGTKVTLPKDSQVKIIQALGGTYTVITDHGYMVGISDKEADALGKQVQQTKDTAQTSGGLSIKDQVWNQLKTCYDPEIPVNIADLGLVYVCEVYELEEGGYRVEIKMTLTAPGCGMGEYLRTDVARKVSSIPGIKDVNVELVWEPQWDQSRMSEAAKLKLNML